MSKTEIGRSQISTGHDQLERIPVQLRRRQDTVENNSTLYLPLHFSSIPLLVVSHPLGLDRVRPLDESFLPFEMLLFLSGVLAHRYTNLRITCLGMHNIQIK